LVNPSVGTGFLGRAKSWFTSRKDCKRGEGTKLAHVPEGQQERGHTACSCPRGTAKGKGTRLVYDPEGLQKGKGTRLVHIPEGQQKREGTRLVHVPEGRGHSVAPAGAYVGIPVTVLNPWVRACACTLSLLLELVSGSQ
jgi:hypothetical protein